MFNTHILQKQPSVATHLVHSVQGSHDAGIVLAVAGGHLQGVTEFRGLQRDISSQWSSPQRAQGAGCLEISLPHHAPPSCL